MGRHLGWRSCIVMVLAAWAAPVLAQDKKAVDPASQGPVAKEIRGRVVDEEGRPLAGITLSTHWIQQEDKPIRGFEGVAKTDDQGRFQVDLKFYYGRSESLCALDLDKKRGGLAVVGPKTPDEPITIKAGPLIHLHGKYVCKELGTPVGWTNTMFMSMPEKWRVCENMTAKGEFSVFLPAGDYSLQGYGGTDVAGHRRELTLRADKTDVDLGQIDLVASEIAKLKGKSAPTLHPTDTRGVSKSVQIADYKGKWVAMEFWGHWCGPCVGHAIPRMMEIYDDHQDERGKYVVLTVHSAIGGKDFAEVDEKLVPVIRDIWGGRMLPFPILLDSEGTIQKTFGVAHWPTTLLFDPEGKLVGEIQPDDLEKKLTPVPLAVSLPRQLDRNTTIYFRDPSLKDALANLKEAARAEFDIDPEVLKKLQQGEETKIPLTIAGQVSLRSALELLLDPIDLTAKVGPKGYIIARKPSDASSTGRTSESQARCAARIEGKLKESRYSYDFDKTPLEKVAAFFEEASGENVVLDPRGRMQGKIDPKTSVTGSGKDVLLGEALEKLAGPLDLRVVVRDEVIVLEARGDRPAAAASR
jgi:thiol-disulfide isomerase/thioredoxin